MELFITQGGLIVHRCLVGQPFKKSSRNTTGSMVVSIREGSMAAYNRLET
jgi:hypothetical protein